MNRKQFLEVLFDHDHISTCGRDDKAATYPKPVFPDLISAPGEKFSINPIKTWRDTKNVVEAGLYSMLFEMDKDSDGNNIPREKQVELFKSSGIPYSTMTWSGTKSVHVIVRMERQIPELLFDPLWSAITRVLTKWGCSIDPATMKIPQISRMPESMRRVNLLDDEGNIIGHEMVKQDLIDVRHRISMQELGQWLKANGETIDKPKPRQMIDWDPDANSSIEDMEKWEAAYNMYKKKHGEIVPNSVTGNWVNFVNLSTYLYKVDLSLTAAIILTSQKFGLNFSGSTRQFTIDEPITDSYNWSNKNRLQKIQLKSKQEYRKELFAAAQERNKLNYNKYINQK